MRVRRFGDAAEFYAHVEPFLMAHEAEHCVMIGVCTTLIKTDTYQEPPYLACVEAPEGNVVAVAMRTPPYNLLLSTMEQDHPLPVIADDVQGIYSELSGVIGTKHLSKTFAELWKSRTGQHYRLNMNERLYRLEHVRPVKGVTGECRQPTDADREILIQWFIEFSAEALDGMSREDAERQVDMRLTGDPTIRGIRAWYENGQPVSFAGYGGPTPNAFRIGPVYTPPAYRGRGYASACVAALSQELLDMGRKFVFLFTDLSNPTSNHIYQNIGYEPVCDVDQYQFV